mmetsp:Transcript_18662/g.29087  ORF Transcript_18662/g.29087 Transcript_18662/m.29087 type:complete len:271 (-) Transcript_18662:1303-2115(-)|eukprot:CAMPEP_0184307920 /NCGR_PEP_ID=MMETSP1049-20130417/16520_1 /TAXON_ID=77928 /ORGANISM="Proteomonas sulcata, Strain CCMP704" /LENGTH=270 /DNA_ID=CAMNT_0026620509 /DNA_START=217 /DNA_END=1029 /DNA_ORIENTATION=-
MTQPVSSQTQSLHQVWNEEDDKEFQNSLLSALGLGGSSSSQPDKRPTKKGAGGKAKQSNKAKRADSLQLLLDGGSKSNSWLPEGSLPSFEIDADENEYSIDFANTAGDLSSLLKSELSTQVSKKSKQREQEVAKHEGKIYDFIRKENEEMGKKIHSLQKQQDNVRQKHEEESAMLISECEKLTRNMAVKETRAQKNLAAFLAEDAAWRESMKARYKEWMAEVEKESKELLGKATEMKKRHKRDYEELEEMLKKKKKVARELVVKAREIMA